MSESVPSTGTTLSVSGLLWRHERARLRGQNGGGHAEHVRGLGDGASNVVVDLAGVGFIDSTGLRVLLKALPRFEQRGGRLVLVSDDRRVLRTLEITGLDRKFVLEPRLSEAIAQVVGGDSVPSADGKG